MAKALPRTPDVAPTPEEFDAPVVPPSLTSKAFLDEIRTSARDQRTSKQRREDERNRLEALAKEVADARAALRAETERLEAAKKPAASAGTAEEKAKSYVALAKTVKGMRPEKAAELVSNLDRPLAVELLRRIRPADAAAILEKLKADTAADLVSRMASAGPEAP
jgi:flagellar motility protein MotE (MotC chaperone)